MSFHLLACPNLTPLVYEDKFLSKHRVGSIKDEMIISDIIDFSETAKVASETRMNDCYILARSTESQRECLSLMQHTVSYQDYYKSRTTGAKDRLDEFFDSCNRNQWRKVAAVKQLAKPFYDAHKMCSQVRSACVYTNGSNVSIDSNLFHSRTCPSLHYCH